MSCNESTHLFMSKYDLRETHPHFVIVDPLIALYFTNMSIQTVLLVCIDKIGHYKHIKIICTCVN